MINLLIGLVFNFVAIEDPEFFIYGLALIVVVNAVFLSRIVKVDRVLLFIMFMVVFYISMEYVFNHFDDYETSINDGEMPNKSFHGLVGLAELVISLFVSLSVVIVSRFIKTPDFILIKEPNIDEFGKGDD